MSEQAKEEIRDLIITAVETVEDAAQIADGVVNLTPEIKHKLGDVKQRLFMLRDVVINQPLVTD